MVDRFDLNPHHISSIRGMVRTSNRHTLAMNATMPGSLLGFGFGQMQNLANLLHFLHLGSVVSMPIFSAMGIGQAIKFFQVLPASGNAGTCFPQAGCGHGCRPGAGVCRILPHPGSPSPCTYV